MLAHLQVHLEKICFLAHVKVGRTRFLTGCQTEASVPQELLARGLPRFLAMEASPSSKHGSWLHQSEQMRRPRESAGKMDVTVLGNLLTEVTFIAFVTFHLLEATHWVQPSR